MPENIAAALKGLGVTLVMLAAFLIIAALLLVFTDLHESTVKTITPFVRFGSVFCGAFTAASQNGHKVSGRVKWSRQDFCCYCCLFLSF